MDCLCLGLSSILEFQKVSFDGGATGMRLSLWSALLAIGILGFVDKPHYWS